MWRNTTLTKIPRAAAQGSSSIFSSKRFPHASKRWPRRRQNPRRVPKKCPRLRQPRNFFVSLLTEKNWRGSRSGSGALAQIPREAQKRQIQARAEGVVVGFAGGEML